MLYLEREVYDRIRCVVFCKTHEAFGDYSNMAAGFPLTVNGTSIRTSEALYQVCRFPSHPDIQREIIDQASPMAAKMVSKKHRDRTRADWDEIKIDVMRWCLDVKLVQNTDKFAGALIASDDSPIVELSRRDTFWGAVETGLDRLEGYNILGKLLMELRDAVRLTPDYSGEVHPLEIERFDLLGSPIGVVEAVTDRKINVNYTPLLFEEVRDR